MTKLSNVCGASPANNHLLLFDRHDSHFDDHALRNMECQKIQLFVLKAGNPTNDHLNDNDPNTKLKYLYN